MWSPSSSFLSELFVVPGAVAAQLARRRRLLGLRQSRAHAGARRESTSRPPQETNSAASAQGNYYIDLLNARHDIKFTLRTESVLRLYIERHEVERGGGGGGAWSARR